MRCILGRLLLPQYKEWIVLEAMMEKQKPRGVGGGTILVNQETNVGG